MCMGAWVWRGVRGQDAARRMQRGTVLHSPTLMRRAMHGCKHLHDILTAPPPLLLTSLGATSEASV